MSFASQYNISPVLTPVRVVATSNQTGTYVNGPLNNGVGATFTYATGVLTIDSVVVNLNDDVLLTGQTAANQNGIYVCTVLGAVGVAAVLTRRHDFQCIEQLYTGQYVSVKAGTVDAGNLYTLIEPKPAQMGISNLVFSVVTPPGGTGTAAAKAASDNTSPTLASVEAAPTVANSMVVFADTAGSVKDATQTVTNAFGLTLASGSLTTTSPTAANGTLSLTPVNAGGAFNTVISNGTMAQSTTYTLPDIGATTGDIVVSTAAVRMKSVAGAANAGGSATTTITDAFCTSGSNVLANWNTSANAVSIQKVTPGTGSFVVLSSGDPGASTLNYVIMK